MRSSVTALSYMMSLITNRLECSTAAFPGERLLGAQI
jgi:hypothetical protein